jgi:hypothetical protein
LQGLFGNAPRARLAAVRAEARRKRAQKRAFRVAAWLAMIWELIAIAVAFALGRVWVAAFAGLAGALVTAAFFAVASFAARASTAATQRAQELESGISGLALFTKSDTGHALIQRIQRDHPLLVRIPVGEGSTAPPPPTDERITLVPK